MPRPNISLPHYAGVIAILLMGNAWLVVQLVSGMTRGAMEVARRNSPNPVVRLEESTGAFYALFGFHAAFELLMLFALVGTIWLLVRELRFRARSRAS
jgi:hypothetical protein